MKEIVLKETANIKDIADVENRLYHAFDTYRRLPEYKVRSYYNPLAGMMVDEPIEATKLSTNEIVIFPVSAKDITLADEVLMTWWTNANLTIEEKELIQARCGTPLRNKYDNWSKVRSWKTLAYDFNVHRHTIKIHWDKAMKKILDQIPEFVKLCA